MLLKLLWRPSSVDVTQIVLKSCRAKSKLPNPSHYRQSSVNLNRSLYTHIKLLATTGDSEPAMPRFSDTVMDHFSSPRNNEKLSDPDLVGLSGAPGQGRYLAIYLRIQDRQIVESGFQCHGCGGTIAAASMLTEMIADKSLDDCLRITADDLLEALGGLPPDKRHCAGMAVGALHQAINEG